MVGGIKDISNTAHDTYENIRKSEESQMFQVRDSFKWLVFNKIVH